MSQNVNEKLTKKTFDLLSEIYTIFDLIQTERRAKTKTKTKTKTRSGRCVKVPKTKEVSSNVDTTTQLVDQYKSIYNLSEKILKDMNDQRTISALEALPNMSAINEVHRMYEFIYNVINKVLQIIDEHEKISDVGDYVATISLESKLSGIHTKIYTVFENIVSAINDQLDREKSGVKAFFNPNNIELTESDESEDSDIEDSPVSKGI